MVRIFFVITCAFIALISKGQSFVPPQPEQSVLACIYRLTYQPDSAVKATQTEYMRLVIGKNLSKFESDGFFLRDSLMNAHNSVTPSETQESLQKYVDQVSALPRSKFVYSIYKNAASGHLYCYDRVGFTAFYRYNEPDNLFKWKILNNKATMIAGYACQKATTTYAGRNYEAWFTREIPIPEGPYKFYGLPGLIVKVSDTRQQYIFELVKLKKSKTIALIALPTQAAKLTTKSELLQGQINYELGMLDRVVAMGNKVTEEEKLARREKIKRQNNPLELK